MKTGIESTSSGELPFMIDWSAQICIVLLIDGHKLGHFRIFFFLSPKESGMSFVKAFRNQFIWLVFLGIGMPISWRTDPLSFTYSLHYNPSVFRLLLRNWQPLSEARLIRRTPSIFSKSYHVKKFFFRFFHLFSSKNKRKLSKNVLYFISNFLNLLKISVQLINLVPHSVNLWDFAIY